MIVSLPPSLPSIKRIERQPGKQERKGRSLAETGRPTNRPGVSSPLAVSGGMKAMLRIHAIPLEKE